jgi:hypothetical protein
MNIAAINRTTTNRTALLVLVVLAVVAVTVAVLLALGVGTQPGHPSVLYHHRFPGSSAMHPAPVPAPTTENTQTLSGNILDNQRLLQSISLGVATVTYSGGPLLPAAQ